MNYLYHMKMVFDMLLNSRDQNKDAKNFGRRWRGLSLKKQSKKMQFLITTTVGARIGKQIGQKNSGLKINPSASNTYYGL
jgi:hypothetical protein